MLIAGIHTLTLLDYPGKIACIIFTAGCNFRCGFCHNPQFVLPEEIQKYQASGLIPEEKIFSFLESRRGLLDGVVISGGEPTIHPNLPKFLKRIKNLGFLVKLDTNGTNPDSLNNIINSKNVDYIAMDIKSSLKKYSQIVECEIDKEAIKKSRNLIMSSGIDYEFRTTVLSEFHDESEIEEIAKFCKDAKKFTIQNFRNQKVLNPEYQNYHGFTKEELNQLKTISEKYVSKAEILI